MLRLSKLFLTLGYLCIIKWNEWQKPTILLSLFSRLFDFFSLQWMYIVPVVIFMMLTSQQPEQQEGSSQWSLHSPSSSPPGGGVLPYITYTGMCRPTGSWFWSSWFRTGYNISNARKLQFCKQPFEIIQGQITFKNTVQCVNKQTVVLLCCTLERSIKKLAHF